MFDRTKNLWSSLSIDIALGSRDDCLNHLILVGRFELARTQSSTAALFSIVSVLFGALTNSGGAEKKKTYCCESTDCYSAKRSTLLTLRESERKIALPASD